MRCEGAVVVPPAPPCKPVFSRGCVTRSESQAGANIPSQVLRRPVSGFGFLGLIPCPDRPLTDPAYQSAKSFPQDPLDTLAAIRDAQQAPHADQNLCPMLHVVEIRYGDDTSASIVASMRRWLIGGGEQPATLRYSSFGPATVVHVDFEQEIEANAFAQAFGGVVLPSRP